MCCLLTQGAKLAAFEAEDLQAPGLAASFQQCAPALQRLDIVDTTNEHMREHVAINSL